MFHSFTVQIWRATTFFKRSMFTNIQGMLILVWGIVGNYILPLQTGHNFFECFEPKMKISLPNKCELLDASLLCEAYIYNNPYLAVRCLTFLQMSRCIKIYAIVPINNATLRVGQIMIPGYTRGKSRYIWRATVPFWMITPAVNPIVWTNEM